ncbi:MAG TPA: hypothetical protein ENJ76_01570 [Oceanithermus sp.]|nr:hypothetical protein [Oceanithermus sp.]
MTVVGVVLLFLVVVPGGSPFVRWVLSRVPAARPSSGKEGIEAAGRWIGYLERTLILALILAGEPAGVGFVFAGKAIARFSEREQVEYYLLGTFASFTWAVVLALAALALV